MILLVLYFLAYEVIDKMHDSRHTARRSALFLRHCAFHRPTLQKYGSTAVTNFLGAAKISRIVWFDCSFVNWELKLC